MKTRFISVVIVMMTSLNLLAADRGDCGDGLYWEISNGKLTIYGGASSPMTNYSTTSTAPWYSKRASIQTVEIYGGTTIGTYAFYGCNRITSVKFASTNLKSIGNNAFYGCSSLKSVDIPSNITTISENTFYGCSSLTSVTLPSSLKTIASGAFNGCKNMTDITIPYSVSTINVNAFTSCSNLKKVNILSNNILAKDYDTSFNLKYTFGSQVTEYYLGSLVKRVGNYSFYGCDKLATITISESVASIGTSAFGNCNNLRTVTLKSDALVNKTYTSSSNLKTIFGTQVTKYILSDEVSGIGSYAFYGCSSLSSVTIPNSVTSIGNYAFYNCSKLSTIYIPNSVTSIGNYAFYNCNSLVSVTISDNLKSIGSYAFQGCSSMKSIELPDNVTSIGRSAFCNCSSMTTVNIPQKLTIVEDYVFNGCSSLTIDLIIPNGVTSIGELAFAMCENIPSVTIPEGVTTINKSAFAGCDKLSSVIIPASVKSMGTGVFNGCDSLKIVIVNSDAIVYKTYTSSLNLNNIFGKQVSTYVIGESVKGIGDYAFYDCNNLISVSIPESVTSIGKYAFSKCTNMPSIVIPKGVNSIGEKAFEECKNLKSVTLDCNSIVNKDYKQTYTTYYDNTISTIFGTQVLEYNLGANVKGIGECAFASARNLLSINISNNVTDIRLKAFENCIKMASIIIPNSVTDIGIRVFYGCSSLASVTIPNSVKNIGEYAFYGCSSLSSITIPNSVTNIGSRTFSACNLSYITVDNGNEVFDSRNNCNAIIETATNTLIVGCKNTIIPNTTINIGSSAFYNCNGMFSITIPASVINIGSRAFESTDLSTVICLNNNPAKLGYYAFNQSNLAYIYVPCGTIEAYKTEWEAYSSTICYSPNDNCKFSVTFVDWDGNVLTTEIVSAGESAIPPTNPTRVGYTFSGWDIDYSNVQADMTITAQYAINVYNVDFLDWDKRVITTQQVNYGNAATPPQDPKREGYTFAGWDKDFSFIKEDMTITATYKLVDAVDNLFVTHSLEEVLANPRTRIYNLQGLEVSNIRERLPQGTYIFQLGDKVGKAVFR